MPFFIRKPTKRKLKDARKKNKSSQLLDSSKTTAKDVEIESGSEDEDEPGAGPTPLSVDEEEDTHLSAQEKRVKLAQKYLKAVEEEEKHKLTSDCDHLNDIVLKRLQNEELEKAGKLRKEIADTIRFDIDQKSMLTCKQHKLSITCIEIAPDSNLLFSSSKDRSIVKWCLKTLTKLAFIDFKCGRRARGGQQQQRHQATINCLAVSGDNKYLVSGDDTGIINVWLTSDLQFVKAFDGHRKAITDLAVCSSTNTLYSTSKDALVKCWSMDELGYMETLSGHQDAITCVDILDHDHVVTAGGVDKSLRVWKIQQDSHLIHNAPSGSVDIVRKLTEQFFVSGSDEGNLCLWSTIKKKPLFTESQAHSVDLSNHQPNWITALAVFPNGDLFVSGSCNGCLSLWKWAHRSKSFHHVGNIPVQGYVNCLQFTSDGRYLVVGIGREHKLGRWVALENAKNSILCIPLITSSCDPS